MNRRTAILTTLAGLMSPTIDPAPLEALTLKFDTPQTYPVRVARIEPILELADDRVEDDKRVLVMKITGWDIFFEDGSVITNASDKQLYDAAYQLSTQNLGDMIERGEVLDITGGE